MGETGHICLPICVEHSETNFVGASLDGAVDEKRIVEIKCPTEPETFEIVKAGRVPPQYLAQVQHNLYAAEADVCDFVAFFKGEGAILSVTRNEKYITQLINSEQMFWDWVTDKKFPVGDGESNRDGDEEWKMCVERYLTAQAQVRFGEHNLRRAKVGLMRAMNSSAKVRGAGVTVSMRVKSGYVEQKPRTVEEALILTVAHLD
jgi:predicted phage-related endonuclease